MQASVNTWLKHAIESFRKPAKFTFLQMYGNQKKTWNLNQNPIKGFLYRIQRSFTHGNSWMRFVRAHSRLSATWFIVSLVFISKFQWAPRPMEAYCGRCLIAERWTTKLCTLWSIELSFSYLASNRTRSTSQVFDANELFPVISIFVSIIYISPGERKQARKERKEARNKFPFHVFKSSLVLLLSARIMRSTSKRTNYMYNDCCLTHMQLKSLSLRLSHVLDRINWKWKEYFLDIV